MTETELELGAPEALFSIHDVMPETLPQVGSLLRTFEEAGLPPPALLVVPGKAWTAAGIAHLQRWEALGAELLAHGWHHHTQPRRLYHRLHAALISRNVAEHLALDTPEIEALLLRARDWFGEVGLAPPTSYVPPAWALGAPPEKLPRSPYTCIETLDGVWLRDDLGVYRRRSLPLLGFEADTGLRAWFLRRWNSRQRARHLRRALPLRISIHPRDAQLKLADDLREVLRQPWHSLRYAELGFESAG